MQNFKNGKNHPEFLRITYMLSRSRCANLCKTKVLLFINKIVGQIHFRDHSTGQKMQNWWPQSSDVKDSFDFPIYLFIHSFSNVPGKPQCDFTKYMAQFACRCKGAHAHNTHAHYYLIALSSLSLAVYKPDINDKGTYFTSLSPKWAKGLDVWQHRLTGFTMTSEVGERLRNYIKSFFFHQRSKH